MHKAAYVSRKGEGIFRATLLRIDDPELAVIILSGDGSSDSLQSDLESDDPFAMFLDRNLPENIDIVVDAEHLTFAGSLLLGTLGDLFYNKMKKEMLFTTGGDFEVQKKLEQLIKLYNIEESRFLFWLDEALARFKIPDRIKDEIFVEKTEIGGVPSWSPEMNFIRRSLGKGDQIDEKITRAKSYLEKLYREGFFRLDDQENALVLSAPMFQLVVFLFLRDVLTQFNLFSGSKEEPGKFNQTELEWIVYEIMENARTHGYDSSDFGIIFVSRHPEKDRLSLIFEDHGGHKPSTYRGAKRAYLGIQNLLLEKFSQTSYRHTSPPLQFEKSVSISRFELNQRLEKAKEIVQNLLRDENLMEELGPGYQVTLNIPLAEGGKK